jgi:hypothetical protein
MRILKGEQSMQTILTIADDLANQLQPYEDQLSEILKLGIHEWQARKEAGYNGISSDRIEEREQGPPQATNPQQ